MLDGIVEADACFTYKIGAQARMQFQPDAERDSRRKGDLPVLGVPETRDLPDGNAGRFRKRFGSDMFPLHMRDQRVRKPGWKGTVLPFLYGQENLSSFSAWHASLCRG